MNELRDEKAKVAYYKEKLEAQMKATDYWRKRAKKSGGSAGGGGILSLDWLKSPCNFCGEPKLSRGPCAVCGHITGPGKVRWKVGAKLKLPKFFRVWRSAADYTDSKNPTSLVMVSQNVEAVLRKKLSPEKGWSGRASKLDEESEFASTSKYHKEISFGDHG